jgi:ATP-dependent Lon protease
VTLRGRVLPIGGVKEKLLAAERGGMTTVLLPKANRKDLREIPRRVLKSLRIILVDHMDDVLRHALLLDDPRKYFGERRLCLEYRNGELWERTTEGGSIRPSGTGEDEERPGATQ